MAKAEYRSAIRSRRLINEALVDILQEKPLDKITVTEVVARAGINRGTFYAHYVDISDVVQHLIQDTFSKIQAALSVEQGQIQQLPEILMGHIRDLLFDDLDFYRKVMASGAANLMYEQLVEFVIQYLLEHEPEYSVVSQRQYEITIRFCAGGLSNLYRDWFAGRLDMSLDALTGTAVELLRGVLNPSLTTVGK